MADVKVQLVVGEGEEQKVYTLTDEDMAKLGAACKQPKDFGGTEYKDPEYGSVEVEVRGKKYVVVVGNWEWIQAEKLFKVKGVRAVIRAWESEENRTEFIRIALSRNHKNLKTEEVAMLRDFKRDKRVPLEDAVERAIAYSKPHDFADEEVDPKALETVRQALLLQMGLPQSTSTS